MQDEQLLRAVMMWVKTRDKPWAEPDKDSPAGVRDVFTEEHGDVYFPYRSAEVVKAIVSLRKSIPLRNSIGPGCRCVRCEKHHWGMRGRWECQRCGMVNRSTE